MSLISAFKIEEDLQRARLEEREERSSPILNGFLSGQEESRFLSGVKVPGGRSIEYGLD